MVSYKKHIARYTLQNKLPLTIGWSLKMVSWPRGQCCGAKN